MTTIQHYMARHTVPALPVPYLHPVRLHRDQLPGKYS